MARPEEGVTEAAPGEQLLRRSPRVSWTDAAGPHAVVVESRTIVGSADEVALQVKDATVSRVHAELDPQPGGLWVNDLASRNGTFVDGIRVRSACVPEGGQVRVGQVELRVNYAPEPTAREIWPEPVFGPLVGTSAVMRELFARLARIAPTESSVLIQGETGTGKDLVARALHEASPRVGGPFVVVDCGALPETLLEAELFGHARGAFTGAVAARAGALEGAEGGTVFLDEIAELPLAMQPKLLRAVESRVVRRLGETQFRAIDVRFVSATHRDLGAMVNARTFREDLYFRLAVIPITIPPLRERPGDIGALVRHFAGQGGGGAFEPHVLPELMARPWPGNVRELRNFVERARTLGAREALALGGGAPSAGRPGITLPEEAFALPFKEVREQWLDQVERAYLQGLLERHGRNVTAAAAAAGLNRTFLHRLIRRHGL